MGTKIPPAQCHYGQPQPDAIDGTPRLLERCESVRVPFPLSISQTKCHGYPFTPFYDVVLEFPATWFFEYQNVSFANLETSLSTAFPHQ